MPKLQNGDLFPDLDLTVLDRGRAKLSDIYADHERHHLQPAFFLLDPERRIRHISVQSGGMARPAIEEFVALVSMASRRKPA